MKTVCPLDSFRIKSEVVFNLVAVLVNAFAVKINNQDKIQVLKFQDSNGMTASEEVLSSLPWKREPMLFR